MQFSLRSHLRKGVNCFLLLNERFAQMEENCKDWSDKVKSDHPPTEGSGEKASPFCFAVLSELTTLVICTCLPTGNMPMTSVLLFSCLLIVDFHLKLLENPKASGSVLMCKYVPQRHKTVWACWGQLMASVEGSRSMLAAEKISLPQKLAKSLRKSATYIRNIKLLGRRKLCFSWEKILRSFSFYARECLWKLIWKLVCAFKTVEQYAVKKVLWEISNILYCSVLKLVYYIMSSKNHFRRLFLFW